MTLSGRYSDIPSGTCVSVPSLPWISRQCPWVSIELSLALGSVHAEAAVDLAVGVGSVCAQAAVTRSVSFWSKIAPLELMLVMRSGSGGGGVAKEKEKGGKRRGR